MSNRFIFVTFGVCVVVAILAALTQDATAIATGVSCAFLGGILKAVGSVVGGVVKTVGKVIGVGGDSKAPIKVTTASDPNLTAAIQANNAAIASLASSQQKKSFPTWGWFAIGGGVLLVGYFLLRKR